MASPEYGPQSVIWSSEPATPWISPTEQLTKLALSGGIALGAAVGAMKIPVGNEGGTLFDTLQRRWRNFAMRTPWGLANTFRLSEFASPWMSAAAQQLEPGVGALSKKPVSVYSIGSEFTATPETQRMLRSVVGEQAYTEAGLHTAANFELRYEREPGGVGRGTLLARETRLSAKGTYEGVRGWQKLSDAVNLFATRGPADFLDLAAESWTKQKTNPALLAVLQTLNVPEDLYGRSVDKIFAKTGPQGEILERAPYAFVPSIRGPASSADDLLRRASLVGAYPAFGMQRFNRLLEAVAEQVPILGKAGKKMFGQSGLFDLTVTPGPAHKMFGKFALQSTKLGAAYLGLQELDHYRRAWGTAGEVIASGAVSAGLYAIFKKAARGVAPKTAKHVAVASFFGQLLLPGFDEGVVEGMATSATKIDVLRSGLGTVTGASFYRRTLEGFFPGVSNWETGALAGLGVLGLSYSNTIPRLLLERETSLLPAGVLKKIGFMTDVAVPESYGNFLQKEYHQLAIGGSGDMRVKKGGRVPGWQMAPKEYFNLFGHGEGPLVRQRIEKELFGRARKHGVDEVDWLRDELYARRQRAFAERRDFYLKDNSVNRSLEARVKEINKRYYKHGTPKGLSRAARAVELGATKFYHSFFGASMAGADFRKSMESLKAPVRIGRAGTLFFGALLAHQLFTGGLIGSMEGPGELQDIYSGRQLVEVKRGRWWECLDGKTLIPLADGTGKFIKDIKIGDTVFDKDGEEVNVLKTHQYELEDKDFYEIRTWGNGFRLKATGNHSLFVYRNNEIIEDYVTNLTPDDYLIYPVSKPKRKISKLENIDRFITDIFFIKKDGLICPAQHNYFTKKIQFCRGYRIPDTITLDKDFGYLLGLYFGDGNLMQDAKGLEFAFQLNEKHIVSRLANILKEKFKINVTVRIKKWEGHDSCYIVRCCSSILGSIFKGLFGTEKRIPYWMNLVIDDDFYLSFYKGLFDADGHARRSEEAITAKNYSHLLFIRTHLLSRFQQWSSLRDKCNPRTDIYTLAISSNKSVPKGVRYKDGYIFLKVREIVALEELQKPEFVYDLTTSGSHTYLTTNGAVHNSGGTPYEGIETTYMRPHAYHLMMTRARERATWGPDEDELSPIQKFFYKNFTYELERRTFYDRPYPMTSAGLQDIPIIGNILAGTVGRLIKSPRLMHTSEFMRIGPEGEVEFAHKPEFGGPSMELGGKPLGIPRSPFDAGFLASEAQYKFREISGLTGFATNVMQEAITGTETFGTQYPVFAQAGSIDSTLEKFWDMNVGGALFMCFPGNTPVETDKGSKPIESIETGDMALNQNGYYKVLKNIRRKLTPSERMIRVQATELGVDFTSTSNHIIPILRRHRYRRGHLKPFRDKDYEIIEVPVADVRLGDFLFYPIDKTEKKVLIDLAETGSAFTDKYVYRRASSDFARGYELLENNSELTRQNLRNKGIPDKIAKEVLRQYRHGPHPYRIKRYIEVDEEMAYCIGWYLAEGSNGGSNNSHFVYTMHIKEENYAKRILHKYNTLGFNGAIDKYPEKNSLVLRIHSTQLTRYFDVTFGRGAGNKFIPKAFKQLPIKELEKLTEGLILGDGWTKGFTSKSKQLTIDLAECLLRLDQYPYLKLDYLEKAHSYYPQGSKRKDTLRNYISFREGREQWRHFEGSFLVRVNKLEEVSLKDEYVYDLAIEDKHYYTASRVIVHNSEPIRRFLPRPRSELEEYNPIRNRMPSWMPDRFAWGDPYRKIESGYVRLPGAGYETLYPELAGMDYEEYPLVHKYAILAGISPESRITASVREQLYQRRLQGITAPAEERMMDTITQNLSEVLAKRQFDRVDKNAIELPGSGITQAAVAEAQNVVRDITAPAEYMVPMGFRPFQKLMPDRTMTEQYEFERLYGSQVAFWDKPWRDWFRPSLYSAAHMMGWEGKPQWRKDADETGEYFDKLEFMKWMNLANSAESPRERIAYLREAQETRYGINPQGDAMSIYMTLPQSEKKFFDAFSNATGRDREKILEMIPEDQHQLYQTVWARADAGDKTLYPGSMNQVNEAHLTQRFAEIQDYFTDKPTPKPDWIGWHGDVELDDIKLKYIDTLGKELHDYDMWERQKRMLARKPYLRGADAFLYEGGGPGRSDVARMLYHTGRAGQQGVGPNEFYVHSSTAPRASTRSSIYYNDDRESDILGAISEHFD